MVNLARKGNEKNADNVGSNFSSTPNLITGQDNVVTDKKGSVSVEY
jgi:hypothetical protein